MKKVSLHIFSFVLAFVVLFSTMSFTVNKHYCGKQLIGHSVFSSAKKCGSEMISCSSQGNLMHMLANKDKCCTNKKESIEGQDQLKTSSFSFDLDQPFLSIPINFLLPEFINELPLKETPDLKYKPPLLVIDFQIIGQVFLI